MSDEYIYGGSWGGDLLRSYVLRFRVTKRTAKRIYYQRPGERIDQHGGARGDEFRRLLQAWRKIDPDVSANPVIQATGEEFRYVLHADVARFEAEGWAPLSALNGTHHGEYAVLMRRRVNRF